MISPKTVQVANVPDGTIWHHTFPVLDRSL